MMAARNWWGSDNGAHYRFRAERTLAIAGPAGPGHHHIHIAATALEAGQSLAPIVQRHLGAVALGLCGWIGLYLGGCNLGTIR
jgi:hypothetical protein